MVKSKFKIIKDKKAWQDLLNRALFKTFFHHLEWENFLENQFHWLKFERYVYAPEGQEQPQALLSLARFKRGGKEHLISHPFCEYGGPLPLVKGIDFQQFKRDMVEQFSGTQIKISFHPFVLRYFSRIPRASNVWTYDVQTLAEMERGNLLEFNSNRLDNGGERESFLFQGLQEKSIDELWQSIDRNRKRSIRKAKESGIEVVEAKTEQEVKQVYDFYVQEMKRHKNIPYPFAFFRFFFQNSSTASGVDTGRLGMGAAKILLAKLDGQIIGGNIFLFYQGIVHSFLCGFSQKHKPLGVHSLVLWEMLGRAVSQGHQVFDFGATKKNSPLREFKARWGADALPILEIDNYSIDAKQRGVKLKKSALRKAWALLPTFLVKILSPYFLKRRL